LFRSTFCHSYACLHVNGFRYNIFFVTIVHLNPTPTVTTSPTVLSLFWRWPPHSQYSVCSAGKNSSIATPHPTSKGHAFNATSTIWNVYSPPPLLFSITVRSPTLPIYSRKIASNALSDTVNAFLTSIISQAVTDA
jgi:hypothetical protein